MLHQSNSKIIKCQKRAIVFTIHCGNVAVLAERVFVTDFLHETHHEINKFTGKIHVLCI